MSLTVSCSASTDDHDYGPCRPRSKSASRAVTHLLESKAASAKRCSTNAKSHEAIDQLDPLFWIFSSLTQTGVDGQRKCGPHYRLAREKFPCRMEPRASTRNHKSLRRRPLTRRWW